MSFGISWRDISAAIRNQAFRNAAAILAFSLHNQALVIIETEEFDAKAEFKAIAKIDGVFGENLVRVSTM